MENASHKSWMWTLGSACRIGVVVALMIPFSGCASTAKNVARKSVSTTVSGTGRAAKATATATKKTGKAAVGAAGSIVGRDKE